MTLLRVLAVLGSRQATKRALTNKFPYPAPSVIGIQRMVGQLKSGTGLPRSLDDMNCVDPVGQPTRLEAAAISNICEGADYTNQWSLREQDDEGLEVTPGLWEINGDDILSEVDKQLLISSETAAALGNTQTHCEITISDAAPLRVQEIAVPSEDRRWVSHDPRSGRGLQLIIVMGVLLTALGLGRFGGSLYRYFERPDELTGSTAINAVVERIIEVESNGDTNAKNSRSSATGLGQFLDDTWLDLIRAHRPDLTKGRSESETLKLRQKATLAREITMRFVEQTALMLRRRGLPVTAGTIYLAHFAGAAGAVAILSASENADAALVMASADATGRTKREQLIKANPFLERFTIADLKTWADRRMRAPGHS